MEQAIVEQAVLHAAQQLEDQLDAQMHQMDKMGEDEVEQLRRRRLVQMKKQKEKKEQWKRQGHGEYIDLQHEKEFFESMKGEESMVCHFYRNNWPCKVMDKHLGILCKKHMECKFAKIDAEKSPYLTDKLKIWMLPTLALIKNEKVVDYVVGFDDMGGRDDFTTDILANRLAAASVIEPDQSTAAPQPVKQSGIRKGEHLTRTEDDEDSDFD